MSNVTKVEVPGGFKIEEWKDEPRRDCTERAFRRYEKYILRAIRENFVIHPSEVSPKLGAKTFVARFRDAIRGYKLYGYKSEIPRGFDVGFIQAHVSCTGYVLMFNGYGQTKAQVVAGVQGPTKVEEISAESPMAKLMKRVYEGVNMEVFEAAEPVVVDVSAQDWPEFCRRYKENRFFLGMALYVFECKNLVEKAMVQELVGEGASLLCMIKVVDEKQEQRSVSEKAKQAAAMLDKMYR
jgi:hypothetical protein